jgi:DNA adenine methylase
MRPFFERLIANNFSDSCDYVEPYAGGASLALSLLLSGSVRSIHLNDLDPAIHAFWWSALRKTDLFLELLRRTPLTLAEWRRQRVVYQSGTSVGRLALGFATFYLNRTNHSGIMNGGVIGGASQRGEWKIDARFNRVALEQRIRRVAKFRKQIYIYNEDALTFLRERPFGSKALVYLDPPYFIHGKSLYLNAYEPNDHDRVSTAVARLKNPWVVSYDDVSATRRLYQQWRSRRLSLLHTARATHIGREVMFFSSSLSIPRYRLPTDVRDASEVVHT